MEAMVAIIRDDGVVRVHGEIDLSNVEMLRDEIRTTSVAYVDLSRVTFLDSSGARMLMELHGRDHCRFAHPSPCVARVLEILGATWVLRADVRTGGS